MPKKKQTKQTKKPVKNDGKITKKKYIKTKIIGGGKMIQMLTLKEKLGYLKDCLDKSVEATNIYLPQYFKIFKVFDNELSFNETTFFKKVGPLKEEQKNYAIITRFILLCLYDHDDYNSYTLLKEYYISLYSTNSITQNIPIFETLKISEEKKTELLEKAAKYYINYKEKLDNFINKIISLATGDGVDTRASPSALLPETGESDGEALVSTSASSASSASPSALLPETGESDGEALVSTSASSPASPSALLPETGESDGEAVRESAALEVTEFNEKNDRQFSADPQFISSGRKFSSDPKFSSGRKFGGAQDQKAGSEEKFFETSMFEIYSDGIVLLTIDDQNDTHTLKVFPRLDTLDSKQHHYFAEKDAIINFFNTKKEFLIIRRYKDDLTNKDYLYDCQLQLMYKLVNILIENINKYEEALKTQLQTNLKDKRFLLKYKTNLLDKLIAIIFEKLPDNVSLVKYGIILKSLKVIILNNKGIDGEYIEGKYSEYLTKRNIEDTEISKIKTLSETYMPKYKFSTTCPGRKDYFEHIINVLYTNKDGNTDETEKYTYDNVKEELEILIKLSASASPGIGLFGKTLNEDNCRISIESVTKYKSYLISEASIGKLELLADYNNKYIQDSENIQDLNSSKIPISNIGADELKTIKDGAEKYREKINNYINKKPHLIAKDLYLETPDKMIAIFNEFKIEYEKIFKHRNLKLSEIKRDKLLLIK